jgi:hypothetical protein
MIVDAIFTARLESEDTPSAACRIHIPTLFVLEIDEEEGQSRFRGQTIREAWVTLPDGTEVHPGGCYLERCSEWLVPSPAKPEPKFIPVEIDLDGFSNVEAIGRGTLLCYLPPHLFTEYLNNGFTEDLALEIPVTGENEDRNHFGSAEPPASVGFEGLDPHEALERIDDLLAWQDLPNSYVPFLTILRTVIRIERQCGGPLKRAELKPLLEYPTAPVREYGRAHLDLVDRPLTQARPVRLSTASQL